MAGKGMRAQGLAVRPAGGEPPEHAEPLLGSPATQSPMEDGEVLSEGFLLACLKPDFPLCLFRSSRFDFASFQMSGFTITLCPLAPGVCTLHGIFVQRPCKQLLGASRGLDPSHQTPGSAGESRPRTVQGREENKAPRGFWEQTPKPESWIIPSPVFF